MTHQILAPRMALTELAKAGVGKSKSTSSRGLWQRHDWPSAGYRPTKIGNALFVGDPKGRDRLVEWIDTFLQLNGQQCHALPSSPSAVHFPGYGDVFSLTEKLYIPLGMNGRPRRNIDALATISGANIVLSSLRSGSGVSGPRPFCMQLLGRRRGSWRLMD